MAHSVVVSETFQGENLTQRGTKHLKQVTGRRQHAYRFPSRGTESQRKPLISDGSRPGPS